MHRIFIISALVLFAWATGSLVPSPARAQQAIFVDCRTLAGDGSFTNPLRIGIVTRKIVVQNCRPLSQGFGFNTRHFIFALSRAASRQSFVGTAWLPQRGAIAGVHPFLAMTGGFIFARSLQHGQDARLPNGAHVRYIRTDGLARGTYVLGVELLDSPLRALQTPWFDLVILP